MTRRLPIVSLHLLSTPSRLLWEARLVLAELLQLLVMQLAYENDLHQCMAQGNPTIKTAGSELVQRTFGRAAIALEK